MLGPRPSFSVPSGYCQLNQLRPDGMLCSECKSSISLPMSLSVHRHLTVARNWQIGIVLGVSGLLRATPGVRSPEPTVLQTTTPDFEVSS